MRCLSPKGGGRDHDEQELVDDIVHTGNIQTNISLKVLALEELVSRLQRRLTSQTMAGFSRSALTRNFNLRMLLRSRSALDHLGQRYQQPPTSSHGRQTTLVCQSYASQSSPVTHSNGKLSVIRFPDGVNQNNTLSGMQKFHYLRA